MGKAKYQERIAELLRKSPVVKFSSLARIVGKKGYAKQLARNLLKKKKIFQLAKGCYTPQQEASLIVFCLQPAYLGLQDALSFHNLWEQETIPVVITAAKVRIGIRKVMGMNVLVRKISKKYLFGYEYYQQGELYLPYSDVEKTLLDLVYFGEKTNPDTLKEICRRIDHEKMKSYLKKYPRAFQKKVELLLKKR